MAEIVKHPIKITETVLRDAHQSLIATKMRWEHMEDIIELLDDVGYHSLEAWGGATFDSCIRFLNEDPWARLRKVKSKAKKTPLQMLLRGQNLLGYKHYADDVVEYFVQKSIANGINIIRIFDALNDMRNLETAIKACRKEGGEAQGTVSYTVSPVHDLEMFVKDAKRLEDMGAHSVCIKDMAGLLMPYKAYDLIKAIKESIKIPVQLHTHYTSGIASMSYIKAVEAGVDVIDCAISPLAMGTSQPPTESVVTAFRDTEYDTGYNLELLSKIAAHFKQLKDKYIKEGLLDIEVMNVDVNALMYQVPGGMISNLISQLKQSNALDKYMDVLNEIPKVRKDSGYPPLVTPTSQIVGTQAVLNIMSGQRYQMVTKEFKALIKGEYGKTPADIPNEVREQILKGEVPITCRPADVIEPELEKIKSQLEPKYLEQDEDVLSYALFPQVAKDFFEKRISDRMKPEADVFEENDGEIIKENQEEQNAKSKNDDEIAVAISSALSAVLGSGNKRNVIKSFRRLPVSLNTWSIWNRR